MGGVAGLAEYQEDRQSNFLKLYFINLTFCPLGFGLSPPTKSMNTFVSSSCLQRLAQLHIFSFILL